MIATSQADRYRLGAMEWRDWVAIAGLFGEIAGFALMLGSWVLLLIDWVDPFGFTWLNMIAYAVMCLSFRARMTAVLQLRQRRSNPKAGA